jgi:Carboxypeptidase regulatory-like domain
MFHYGAATVVSRPTLRAAVVVALAILSAVRPAWSQTRTATLAVTVVDQTGAVIGGATVTVTGTDDVTKAAEPAVVTTSNEGIAPVPNLVPGRYTIEAQFPGFDPRVLANVVVRPGNNKQVALLTVAALKDSVTVARDRQEAAVDPRGTSFGTQLTRDQIEALSDDPVVLRAQLEEMAGPGAVFKVDSFEGSTLPPKAQIRSIRISRDQFAAENHAAGGTSIEIITQPGLGPIRYNAGARFRDGSMSGRSPFTPTKGPELQRNFYFGLNGTLIPEKSSFSVFAFGATSYETPNINIVDGSGTRSEPLPLRTPRDNLNVNAQLDYALTLDHTLRFGYSTSLSDAENLGIGDYDFEERAYATENRFHNIRAQHIGPLGRRAFTRSRILVRWSDSESHSSFEVPTVRVNDAFTRGGAQVAGGQRSFGFNVGTDLDYVRGIHSLRTGLLVDGGTVRADDTMNYLGTYTFESLDAYFAGQPRSYTRRLGDPRIRYETVQAAVYVQDDIKIRRNFTVSAGGRYEAQTHVSDYGSLMPRVGFTWAPFKAGTTVLRSSWGIFYDWLQGNTYEQTLRVDGLKQQEINITDPSYPDPGDAGTAAPSNRYQLSSTLGLPSSLSATAGIDQTLSPSMRVSSTYTFRRSATLLRGRNLNAPIDGVRPDPRFGNVVAVVNDGGSRTHMVGATVSFIKLNWKQTIVVGNYTWTKAEANSTGPFSTPANGDDLSAEWGPAAPAHRFMGSFNMMPVARVGIAVNLRGQSGSPYNVTTGRDLNGDGVFNDRPAGVSRNTALTLGQWDIGLRLTYSLGFGTKAASATQGSGTMVVMGGGGGMAGGFGQAAADKRFQLQFYAAAQNLTNHDNYIGYSGVLASPFFAQPTNVLNPRKIELGMRFGF